MRLLNSNKPGVATSRRLLRAARFVHAMPLLAVAALLSVPLLAQAGPTVSRPVVQALPPASAGDLQDALRRLARDSRDLDALIDAGTASLQLGDIDAAIGFFGRAEELSPGNPRVKVGLAGAFVRSERPLEALRLFDEAEAAGASTGSLAGERGLAYDLVGDNARAQAQYRQAIAARPNDELARRLALSNAISGNRAAFEQALLPMLESRDFGAYRARAFGLAILGQEDEAVAIAEAVMPRDLSAKIVPYLRYMPRLTRAQQAAAANLGIFPRAAQIGRDDPRIAQYAGSSAPAITVPTAPNVPVASASSRLAPSGEPLGPRAQPAAEPARVARRSERAQARGTRTPREQTRTASAASRRRGASDWRSAGASATPAAATPVERRAATPSAAPSPAATVPAQTVVAASSRQGELPPVNPAASGAALEPVILARAENPAPGPAPAPALPIVLDAAPSTGLPPSFDLAAAAGPAAASVAQAPSIATSSFTGPSPNTPPAAAVAEPMPSVDAAFADLVLPESHATPAPGGIDITAITPPREIEKPPQPKIAQTPPAQAKPKPPAHPSRIWVQVATGRETDRLAFDWRRISRKAGDLLDGAKGYVTPWGEANRLLTGPYDSAKAAQDEVTALKAAGIDSFTFTSDAGEEIAPL